MSSLHALISRMNEGDRSAADELFAQTYQRLVQLARLQLRGFPDLSRRHDAESLVHLAWIDLHTALKTVRPGEPAEVLKLVAWKSRLALLDIVAKEERRRRALRSIPASVVSPNALTVDPTPAIIQEIDHLSTWTRFHQVVGELPKDIREVFEVYFYTDENPSWVEIGQLLNLPAHTVRRRVAKARAEIAKRIVGLGELLS